MKKYTLTVCIYDYRGNLKGSSYCAGSYETLEEALNEFASYTSINDFVTSVENDEYVILSVDSEEECGIKSKKFEW